MEKESRNINNIQNIYFKAQREKYIPDNFFWLERENNKI